MRSIDELFDPPLVTPECGHEVYPLPTLDAIEREIGDNSDTHGAPWMALAMWDEVA